MLYRAFLFILMRVSYQAASVFTDMFTLCSFDCKLHHAVAWIPATQLERTLQHQTWCFEVPPSVRVQSLTTPETERVIL